MRVSTGAWRRTCCSPLAQPTPPAAPICVSGRVESPALPRKEEPALGRFQQTPTAAPDEQEPRNLAAGSGRSGSAPSPLCKAVAASCQAAEVAARLREPIRALPQVAYNASSALGREDTNIIGRGLRQIPDVGPVILGKPDVKKTSGASGSSTTVTGSTTGSSSGQSQDTTSQTTSGAGETTTNVVRQTIVVRVHSPFRDAPGSFVEITNFDPGSAKIKPEHLDAPLPVLERGDEPTLLERLTRGHAKIQLYGYASKPGSWDVNQKVARDRVAAVKRYLTTDKFGIPAAAFLEPLIYGKGRTTTPPGPGGKDVEDDAWRKVKVKFIDTR